MFCENSHVTVAKNHFSFANLFLLGLLGSVIVAELILHSVELTPLWKILPVVERELGEPDDQTAYRFRPNREILNIREQRARVQTNAHGMRDFERSRNKPDGIYRIALLGDSFTEALQVSADDMFSYRTELLLNQDNGKQTFEVLNFGMSGFGPLQQLILYRSKAHQFSPQMVVYIVGASDFTNTELSDDTSGPAFVVNQQGELTIGQAFRQLRSHQIKDSWFGTLFFGLMDHSRVARALFLKYKLGATATQPTAASGARPHCANVEQTLRAHVDLWLNANPPQNSTRLVQLLNEFQSEAAKPTYMAIYGLQIPPAECPQQLERRNALIKAIETRLASAAIGFVDMEQALHDYDRVAYFDRRFYGFGTARGHGHLNELGHTAFSYYLANEIGRRMSSDDNNVIRTYQSNAERSK